MSLNDILKEDLDWYKKFHSTEVTGKCDSSCGKDAKRWFGNTSVATCGDIKCLDIQYEEYNSILPDEDEL